MSRRREATELALVLELSKQDSTQLFAPEKQSFSSGFECVRPHRWDEPGGGSDRQIKEILNIRRMELINVLRGGEAGLEGMDPRFMQIDLGMTGTVDPRDIMPPPKSSGIRSSDNSSGSERRSTIEQMSTIQPSGPSVIQSFTPSDAANSSRPRQPIIVPASSSVPAVQSVDTSKSSSSTGSNVITYSRGKVSGTDTGSEISQSGPLFFSPTQTSNNQTTPQRPPINMPTEALTGQSGRRSAEKGPRDDDKAGGSSKQPIEISSSPRITTKRKSNGIASSSQEVQEEVEERRIRAEKSHLSSGSSSKVEVLLGTRSDTKTFNDKGKERDDKGRKRQTRDDHRDNSPDPLAFSPIQKTKRAKSVVPSSSIQTGRSDSVFRDASPDKGEGRRSSRIQSNVEKKEAEKEERRRKRREEKERKAAEEAKAKEPEFQEKKGERSSKRLNVPSESPKIAYAIDPMREKSPVKAAETSRKRRIVSDKPEDVVEEPEEEQPVDLLGQGSVKEKEQGTDKPITINKDDPTVLEREVGTQPKKNVKPSKKAEKSKAKLKAKGVTKDPPMKKARTEDDLGSDDEIEKGHENEKEEDASHTAPNSGPVAEDENQGKSKEISNKLHERSPTRSPLKPLPASRLNSSTRASPGPIGPDGKEVKFRNNRNDLANVLTKFQGSRLSGMSRRFKIPSLHQKIGPPKALPPPAPKKPEKKKKGQESDEDEEDEEDGDEDEDEEAKVERKRRKKEKGIEWFMVED